MLIKNIILTGERNVGKTFMLKRVIKYFSDVHMAGFFTRKNDNGTVTLQPWDNYFLFNRGPEMVLYDVNDGFVRKNVFEELGVWAINRALENANLIIFDELGRFENTCKSFTESIHRALDGNTIVLAVIKAEKNPFLDTIKNRNDANMMTISLLNRDILYAEVIIKINKLLDKS